MDDIAPLIDFPTTLDEMELAMASNEPADCPVAHRFTPGLYVREMTLPAGALVTSMIHKFEHPFVISKGSIKVFSENEGAVIYTAPYCGITKPGTRRMAYALEETIWTTFHATNETDIEKIAEEILVHRVNPLLGANHPSNNQWRISLPAQQLTQ
jgi:hypothetical protein